MAASATVAASYGVVFHPLPLIRGGGSVRSHNGWKPVRFIVYFPRPILNALAMFALSSSRANLYPSFPFARSSMVQGCGGCGLRAVHAACDAIALGREAMRRRRRTTPTPGRPLNWALQLRRAGKSVILIHHAGKSGRQRGTSRKEDALEPLSGCAGWLRGDRWAVGPIEGPLGPSWRRPRFEIGSEPRQRLACASAPAAQAQ
jgi:hypothetical protein